MEVNFNTRAYQVAKAYTPISLKQSKEVFSSSYTNTKPPAQDILEVDFPTVLLAVKSDLKNAVENFADNDKLKKLDKKYNGSESENHLASTEFASSVADSILGMI